MDLKTITIRGIDEELLEKQLGLLAEVEDILRRGVPMPTPWRNEAADAILGVCNALGERASVSTFPGMPWIVASERK